MPQRIRCIVVCVGVLQVLSGGVRAGAAPTFFYRAMATPFEPIDPTYAQAVAEFHTVTEDFDSYVSGQELSNIWLGANRFSMNTGGALLPIVAAHEDSLGYTLPSSPMAAQVTAQATPVLTAWNFAAPVTAWDLTFIGGEGSAYVEVGIKDEPFPAASFLVPQSSFPYRWIGLLSNADDIETIRFTPLSAYDYVFDNVRTAVLPEPAVPVPVFLMLFVGGPMLLRRRRRA